MFKRAQEIEEGDAIIVEDNVWVVDNVDHGEDITEQGQIEFYCTACDDDSMDVDEEWFTFGIDEQVEIQVIEEGK